MSDALRRRFTADRTVPVRRRLSTLEHDLPYSYGEDDDAYPHPRPDPATMARICGALFVVFGRDRELFAAFVRGRAPEISDDDLGALIDAAERQAEQSTRRPSLELIRRDQDVIKSYGERPIA